eukprot:CAMPEP_0113319250 /NCGR_PEP_ID=MMETSP0010_2-20120614/13521_1 /TAXON_ID=216773 ORGANISM="Corethron hystrix, Strain 308" /NCGR_SAMPLE_ID=MMETSP0010_2 /ASSEMBLY_ACC=CAM_ASM_000155 /LENGTH=434 /DNA_ID=CAMNT_0000176769 /DNA_START=30 /DNA_END=1334 /DNA_ORIENTATION=- /assembly_acc=CAM_ASM_000155
MVLPFSSGAGRSGLCMLRLRATRPSLSRPSPLQYLLRSVPLPVPCCTLGSLSSPFRSTLPAPMPLVTVDVPSMGDSITEGTVVEVSAPPGTGVAVDDVVLVLETDKVSIDIRSPEAGVVTEVLGAVDDVVEVGSPLFKIDTDAVAAAAPPVPAAGSEPEPEATAPPPPPSAPASTPPLSSPPPPPTPSPAAAAPATPSSCRGERRVKMSRTRQRIASRLKESQNTTAMLTTFQECDMGNLMELRARHKESFQEKHGVKLGFMSAFVAAATASLREIPAVNAYIDDARKEVVYRDYCDVSVAVASPNGLVVPVLRNTERMSFADIETTISDFGQKAREGTLGLEDMAGGTFTISNGGVFGSLMGTPIINPPQSAILGMHATKMRPMVMDGEVVPRPMMYLALTYDHRLIDGREGVTFLKSIANKIEDPGRLLLDI